MNAPTLYPLPPANLSCLLQVEIKEKNWEWTLPRCTPSHLPTYTLSHWENVWKNEKELSCELPLLPAILACLSHEDNVDGILERTSLHTTHPTCRHTVSLT